MLNLLPRSQIPKTSQSNVSKEQLLWQLHQPFSTDVRGTNRHLNVVRACEKCLEDVSIMHVYHCAHGLPGYDTVQSEGFYQISSKNFSFFFSANKISYFTVDCVENTWPEFIPRWFPSSCANVSTSNKAAEQLSVNILLENLNYSYERYLILIRAVPTKNDVTHRFP